MIQNGISQPINFIGHILIGNGSIQQLKVFRLLLSQPLNEIGQLVNFITKLFNVSRLLLNVLSQIGNFSSSFLSVLLHLNYCIVYKEKISMVQKVFKPSEFIVDPTTLDLEKG